MGALLKNLLLSALFVCVATVAGVTLAASMSFFTDPRAFSGTLPPLPLLAFGLMVALAVVILVGMMFCIVTLMVAALTMPPVIWLSRWLNLPRPLIDVVGGALAAWLCASAGLEEADSLAQYGVTFSAPLVTAIAMLAGALIGYVRYRTLVGADRSFGAGRTVLPAH